jgi:hypothetical protein
VSRRYTYATTLNWGGDTPTAEVEVEVSYTVAWGSPEAGNYGPPEHYDPGSGDLVEDIRLEKVEGKPRPWGMYYGYIANEDDEFATTCIEKIEGSDHHLEAMINRASEIEAARDDEARERQYEARREMAREPDSFGEPW